VRLGVFFWHDSPNDVAAFAGIRAGLQAAGLRHEFVERRADSDAARAAQVLSELRTAGCDLVFAMGTQAVLLAAAALPDLPVVFAAVSNPVASGVVPDWQGSGRKVAGGSNWIPPAAVLRVFRLALPELARLGILRSSASGVVSAAELATMRAHLATPGAPAVQLVEAVAADAGDVARAVRELRDAGVQAIWVPIDFTIYTHMQRVREGLGDARLPLLTTAVNAAREGAVVGATVDFELHGRRVAALALEILRGRDPATMPVDTMQSYLVVANLAAAHAVGHELPLSLLVLADELIDQEAADARANR
jgi:putative ABC transport system substrate-binding protein